MTASDTKGNEMVKMSKANVENIDFKKGITRKYVSDYDIFLKGQISQKSYMENVGQSLFESSWVVNFDGIGNVSGSATRIPGTTNFYKSKLSLNAQDGKVYGNAELCVPSG